MAAPAGAVTPGSGATMIRTGATHPYSAAAPTASHLTAPTSAPSLVHPPAVMPYPHAAPGPVHMAQQRKLMHQIFDS